MATDIPLSNIVNVTVSLEIGGITQTGFGVANIFTNEDTYDTGERTRTYSNLTEVADDWATSSDAYLMAASLFAQSPAPTSVKISTEDTRVAQVQTIVFSADLITGNSVACSIDGAALTATPFNTSNAQTLTDLAAKIQATAGVSTAVSDGSHTITVTAQNAGVPVSISGVLVTSGASQATATITTTTASHGIADDIAEVIDVDDNWYWFLWVEQQKEYVEEAVQAIETLKKQYVSVSDDSGIVTTGDTANVAYFIKNGSYERSRIFYHTDPTSFPDAAEVGKVSVYEPGATQACYQELASIQADELSSSNVSALNTVQAFYYGTMGGRNVLIEPIRTDGKYQDTVRDRDYVESYIQEQVSLFVINKVQSGEKITYTQSGIDMVENQLRSIGDYLVNTKKVITFEGIDEEDRFVLPSIEDVSAADKASRTLNDVSMTCKLTSGIYKFNINGIITS